MDYATRSPELFILLASKLHIKKYESDSTSQIFYSCHASQGDPGTKQYYFPIKISGVV